MTYQEFIRRLCRDYAAEFNEHGLNVPLSWHCTECRDKHDGTAAGFLANFTVRHCCCGGSFVLEGDN